MFAVKKVKQVNNQATKSNLILKLLKLSLEHVKYMTWAFNFDHFSLLLDQAIDHRNKPFDLILRRLPS